MGYDVLLLDGLNVFHRAGFSYELGYWKDSDYYETGAVFGFLRIAMAFWKKHANPGAQLIVCWDAGYTHRTDLYPNYKISRRKPISPENIEAQETKRQHRLQKKLLEDLLELAGWKSAVASGYEADDVLATLAKRYERGGRSVALCTTDQDLHQVVSERVHVISSSPKGEKKWDPEKVLEKWGFYPDRVAELKALMGDGGDDIPGCPGCGATFAKKFLRSYGDLEGVIQGAASGLLTGEWEGKTWNSRSLAGKIVQNADLIRTSHELAKVVVDAPVAMSEPSMREEELVKRLDEVRFYSLYDTNSLRLISEISTAELPPATLNPPSPVAEESQDVFDIFT